MKASRFRTLLIGLFAGVVYAFLSMLLISRLHENVSIAYIFGLPMALGAIPTLFSTKEQLSSYMTNLLLPWGITLTFFFLCFLSGFEGMICLVIIVGPFLLLGSLGAFIFRLYYLSTEKKTPLYLSLFLPMLVLGVENNFKTADQFYTVKTSITINANPDKVWNNIKNVKNIKSSEISTHFIHIIGVPKPLNGQIDKEEIGGIRSITWEKGIKFQEIIKTWNSKHSFTYDIKLDPSSIPPTTLDEHVMIGGRYFDVLEGSYEMDSIAPSKNVVTLKCKYRITTNLDFYSKWWADYILNDFNEMILEVIKKRSE